jgi:hypothetical protein
MRFRFAKKVTGRVSLDGWRISYRFVTNQRTPNRMGRMQTQVRSRILGQPATATDRQTAWRTRFAGVIPAATMHWPEYLMEAACLGLFMMSACSFTVLLHHPASILPQMVSTLLRRFLTGVAMGLTAIALNLFPLG